MNSLLLVSVAELAMAAFILLLLPHMTPRRIYFAITVAPEFPGSAEGRAIMRWYRIGILVALLGSALALAAAQSVTVALAIAIPLPLCAGLGVFLAARSKTKRFAARPASVMEASLDAGEERLPGWFALSAVPFLIPSAAAAYLSAHWDEIPARFAVHWNAADVADRWAEKTAQAVYGPVGACVLMLLLVVMLSVAIFFGSRRAAMREMVLKMNLMVEFAIGLTFGEVSLLPLVQLPLWAIVIPAVAIPLGVVAWAVRFFAREDVEAEVTPDACWRWGEIYYNSQDPALFVQKRIGFGYTFNFANHLSWMILGGLLVVMLAFVAIDP